MVRAILEDRKTVTRRLIKNKDITNRFDIDVDGKAISYIDQTTGNHYPPYYPCRYKLGDYLYVRETWRVGKAHRYGADAILEYRAGGDKLTIRFPFGNTDGVNRDEYDRFIEKWYPNGNWHPSIHMPKEAVRIFLRVNNVRVERLQDITEECAKSEGISEEWARNWWKPSYYDPDSGGYPKYRDTFSHELWESTIKPKDRDKYGWNANPWVWVIEFERADVEE